MSDKLTFKISDLLQIKEITKIINTREKIVETLSKIPFLKIEEDQETVSYIIHDDIIIYKMLNFPWKMTKDDIAKKLEILDLKYERFYKSSIYWILVTNDKETQICVKNILRELYIDDIKIKFENISKTQLIKSLKDIVDKTRYKNESKNLGDSSHKYRKNSNFSNNSTNKTKETHKGSANMISENFSWRKGSNASSSGIKSDNKGYFYKNKNKFKRSRFNSDSDTKLKYKNNFEEEVEIDVDSLKYPLSIKYKYSFKDVKLYLELLKKNDFFKKKPTFFNNEIDEIIINEGDNVKDFSTLDSLIETFEKEDNKKDIENKNNNEGNVIPKVNPLSSLPKMFNKFDRIPGNIVP